MLATTTTQIALRWWTSSVSWHVGDGRRLLSTRPLLGCREVYGLQNFEVKSEVQKQRIQGPTSTPETLGCWLIPDCPALVFPPRSLAKSSEFILLLTRTQTDASKSKYPHNKLVYVLKCVTVFHYSNATIEMDQMIAFDSKYNGERQTAKRCI